MSPVTAPSASAQPHDQGIQVGWLNSFLNWSLNVLTIDFAKKRLQLGESLYYKALENIMLTEKKRIEKSKDKSIQSKVFSVSNRG